MPDSPRVDFIANDLDAIAELDGHIAVFMDGDGKLDAAARRINKLTRGALQRFVDSDDFAKMKPGQVARLAWPAGLAARCLHVARLERRSSADIARRAGAAIGKAGGKHPLTLLAGSLKSAEELALGALLGLYRYDEQKSRDTDDERQDASVSVMVSNPEDMADAATQIAAKAAGVFFTRSLVNSPSNILTTETFAAELVALSALGVEVEVIDEDRLRDLGMNTLLAVGQGSESPSKVVVMRWTGGAKADPLALIGKGVVFDTGGISMKPAAGMEEMTMDMGGAGVVAGVMKLLAMRKARANVVGLVGLVENMPDGRAMRPGDVVKSMKGDTVEVINTDAEGRLVLCDLLWYAQEHVKPAAMIDLATLTGAMVVALGHEHAGYFANDDALADRIAKAAKAEGEGAWRMPLGDAYADLLKSRIADVKNVGPRWGGAITAAEFLHRFVKDGMPWAHIDIAGVASVSTGTPLAPKGATGWGVMTLDRLIRDHYETRD